MLPHNPNLSTNPRILIDGTTVQWPPTSTLFAIHAFLGELAQLLLSDLANLVLFILNLAADLAQLSLETITSLPTSFWTVFWTSTVIYALYKLNIWFWTDFQAYRDLGKGGTPPNFWGWLRIKHLSFFRITSVLIPPHIPPELEPYRGILEDLPSRPGRRPFVAGVAPQRQRNQKASRLTFDVLVNMIQEFAAEFPDLLEVKTSFLEHHNSALFARQTLLSSKREETVIFGHEIAHPHRIDGSLHMIMHPEDVRTVIEAGWGERHPLARANWWWLKYLELRGESRPPVPETLVFVYAPRNREEMAVVRELMMAAIWWISGGVELNAANK